MENKIQLFEKQQVRTAWDKENEKWWMSVLDIIAILMDQSDYTKVRNYWKWLKNKLKSEGSELVSNTNQLKLLAADGKYYKTDVMDGKTNKEYKQYKGLKKENLRDNMTNKELVLSMLAEISTKEISESTNPESFPEHKDVAKRGGNIAKEARLRLEAETGKKVISPLNAKSMRAIENKKNKNSLS